MKLAIHLEKNRFCERWVKYCQDHDIPYKIVNCYDSDIIDQLSDCNGLMWNWNQDDFKAALMARQLTLSLEQQGKKIFPDFKTSWHNNDKVGQKYLLEAIGAPLVKSYVFYSKSEAENWIDKTSFPKVFKLRSGAASINVKLVSSKKQALRLVKKAFSGGFDYIDFRSRLKDKFWVFERDRDIKSFVGVFKGLYRLMVPNELAKFSEKERGYVYFQDFVEGNAFDTRVVVIGDRCIAIRRYVRKNDFRASGSGILANEPELFDKNLIKIAFDVARKLALQSVAFDFLVQDNEHKIIEICYTFISGKYYDTCPGYWDSQLNWHTEKVNLQNYMMEDFIKSFVDYKL